MTMISLAARALQRTRYTLCLLLLLICVPAAWAAAATPSTVPGAPTGVTAIGGNAGATVTFAAPASNGGSAITGYTVTSLPAGGVDSNAGSTGLSHAMTGLSNGTAYTFTVKATNAVGTGAASTASSSVTPATVPGAPTIGSAIASNAGATVTFTAPASNGGSAITGYTVTSLPAGGVESGFGAFGQNHSITVTGLTNGTAYTFTVKATNALGAGAASAASNSVTPATVPGAPTIGAATAGNARATVTFAAPASNGGSAITGYTATSLPAGGVDSNAGTTGLSHVITGLTNGTAYTFTVKATNAVGTSAASAASNSVTPTSVPAVAQAYYIHTDQLDTPRAITDSNGNVVWQWSDTDPYGNNAPNQNPSGQGTFVYNPRFSGQYFDVETNLNYNINRDYDPSIGRYIQSDPIGLAGGSYSTYTYVNGNPLRYVDPLGLAYQMTIGFGGTIIAPGVGGTANFNLGVNFDGLNSSIYIQDQVNYGLGIGGYVGWGFSATGAQGDSVVTGVGTTTGYVEVDGGNGPKSGGTSATLDNCGNPTGASGSWGVKKGKGFGGGAFAGNSWTSTAAFPTLQQVINWFK